MPTCNTISWERPNYIVGPIDEFQINEINVDLRTSGFDNEVLSVDACAVWWERESFYCLPRISVVTWHREPRFQCGSARTCSIWNSSIPYLGRNIISYCLLSSHYRLMKCLRRVLNNWFNFALHRRVYSTVYSVLSECLWKKKLHRRLGQDSNPRPPAYWCKRLNHQSYINL